MRCGRIKNVESGVREGEESEHAEARAWGEYIVEKEGGVCC